MGARCAVATHHGLSLVVVGLLLLASEAFGASYSVNIYTNSALIGSNPVVTIISKMLSRWKLSISSTKLSLSQPSATDLASTNAFIIYASGPGSYYSTEGLSSNPGKLADLSAWIRAGGSLILVNGANGSLNTFVPLIHSLVGSNASCRAAAYADQTRIYRRINPPSSFGSLSEKMFRFQNGDPISGMTCVTGRPIYSSDPTKRLVSISAAITWTVGKGAVTWTGADIVVNSTKSVALVVPAAVTITTSSPPPSRWPPPQKPPPKTRSPPIRDSPRPSPSRVSPSPPPPPHPSPPPPRSSPPPPLSSP
ncbi:hypothetical protein Vretifemale_15571, partial [Volvox reticuliferus]